MVRKRDYIDYNLVEPHHEHVHARLVNWALWVRVRRYSSWPQSPIFRLALSNSRQWHVPEFRPTCDLLDAHLMEREVAKLPPAHRDALRWVYVWGGGPGRIAQRLGVSKHGLQSLVREGRGMVDRMLEPELWRECA